MDDLILRPDAAPLAGTPALKEDADACSPRQN
jgi:hypothetical protein